MSSGLETSKYLQQTLHPLAFQKPHLKGFHVHHVERIVPFISVGEGANWRAKSHLPRAHHKIYYSPEV